MPEQPTVLVVEDEPAQREVLSYNLEAEGFRVSRAENGEEALMLVDEAAPDIIVLDWMLPNVSGIEVCRQLKMRAETRGVPIIMLSARSEEVDRVRGLETGADDYVVKPYSVIELMARVRAQLRRTRPSTVGERLEFEDILLDSETHRVTRDGNVLKLGPTEFRLLTTFMENPAVSGAVNSFWTVSGGATSMSTRAPWTCTSAVCARRCASTAGAILCVPCAVRATPWADICGCRVPQGAASADRGRPLAFHAALRARR